MKTEVICEACGNKFEREKGEYNRSLKQKRKFFCSQSCSTKFSNIIRRNRGEKLGSARFLKKGSQRDEYSEFRYFLRKIRSRHKKLKFLETDITLSFLKELWEKQNGICPLTGWKMDLPSSSTEWESNPITPQRASLDRIIAKEPYIQGNVRYVAHIANMAKYIYSDDEVFHFCESVVKNKANLKL